MATAYVGASYCMTYHFHPIMKIGHCYIHKNALAMDIKSTFDYMIEIVSKMEINNQCIYDEKTCQKWRVCSYIDRNRIHNIEIDVMDYPQSNAPEVYSTYRLLRLLNQLSQHIHLQLDGMGKIIAVVNHREIEDKWFELKDRLVAEYGDVKQGKKMIDNLNVTYCSFLRSIKNSLLHVIYLLRFREGNKFKIELPSVLNEGHMIDVDMFRIISDDNRQLLHGTGYVQHRSSMMDKYDKQIKPLTQCQFDYNFNIEVAYQINSNRVVKHIEANLQEQSCENLINKRTITFTNLTIE